MCFSMELRHWEPERPCFVPILGGGLKEEKDKPAIGSSLPQCVQFAPQTPKSQQLIYW